MRTVKNGILECKKQTSSFANMRVRNCHSSENFPTLNILWFKCYHQIWQHSGAFSLVSRKHSNKLLFYECKRVVSWRNDFERQKKSKLMALSAILGLSVFQNNEQYPRFKYWKLFYMLEVVQRKSNRKTISADCSAGKYFLSKWKINSPSSILSKVKRLGTKLFFIYWKSKEDQSLLFSTLVAKFLLFFPTVSRFLQFFKKFSLWIISNQNHKLFWFCYL